MANGSLFSTMTTSGWRRSLPNKWRMRPTAALPCHLSQPRGYACGVIIRPQLTYENLHPIDEYLFDRRSPFAGHSFFDLVTCCPAAWSRLAVQDRHPRDEWDYLLRLSKQEGVRVETVPEISHRSAHESHK